MRHLFALLLPIIVPAALFADELVLKNGDRVTGKIIKQDGKTITLKSDIFGVVSAPWDQVASLKSDEPVNVVLKDGKSLAGTVNASEGKVEVNTAQTKVDVNAAEVAAIRNADEQALYDRLLKPGILQLWTGNGALGLAGASGNAQALTFTTGVSASRITNTDKTGINFRFIKATAKVNGLSETTAQAVRAGWSYDHNVGRRLFVNLFNDYEYDRFQNLDLRAAIGAGLGFHAVKTERNLLDVLAGADYSHSKFGTPLIRNAAELYWGDDYTFKIASASSFVQSFRMFNNLSDTGNYRINFDAGLVTKLIKSLTWNLALSDRYLSNPLPGRKTNDLLYSTSLGVTFGH